MGFIVVLVGFIFRGRVRSGEPTAPYYRTNLLLKGPSDGFVRVFAVGLKVEFTRTYPGGGHRLPPGTTRSIVCTVGVVWTRTEAVC